MSWNGDPQVASVVGRSAEDLLERRPRRQRLDGFDDAYSDIVDYIVRCTHRIWEEKNVGLIHTHYSVDCPVFALSGNSKGAEVVVRNTLASLAGHPDRSPIAEDVIWSEDGTGIFHSSHRLMSASAHLGPDSMLGPAVAGGHAAIPVIADCVCSDNLIIEEWLVRDYVLFARQFGVDPRTIAERLAREDQEGDQARHAWLQLEADRVRAFSNCRPPPQHPAARIVLALENAFSQDLYGLASEAVSPSIEVSWPGGRSLVGRGAWIGCLMQLRTPMGELRFVLDHFAARPLPDGDVAVALRWWLLGRHIANGVWGPPTGRNLVVLAISHYRLRNGRVLEDFTVFDEVGVLRQAAGGLGA